MDFARAGTKIERELEVHGEIQATIAAASASYTVSLESAAEEAYRLRRWAMAMGIDTRQLVVDEYAAERSGPVTMNAELCRDLFATSIPLHSLTHPLVQDMRQLIDERLRQILHQHPVAPNIATVLAVSIRMRGGIPTHVVDAIARNENEGHLFLQVCALSSRLDEIRTVLLKRSIAVLRNVFAASAIVGVLEVAPGTGSILSDALYGRSLLGNELRVLTLLPRVLSSTSVRCTLTVERLEDAGSYVALSYVWGQSSPDCTIEVDDTEILVRRPLATALANFQKAEPVRLWIDAICINQRDALEKNRQIELMGTIYTHAAAVWIWLEDDGSIAEKAQDPAAANRDEAAMDFVSRVGKADFEEYQPGMDVDIWRGVHSLLERTWWSRLWVIQEVSLARKAEIRVGSRSVDFERFVDLQALWFHYFRLEKKRFSNLRLFHGSPARSFLASWSRLRTVRASGRPAPLLGQLITHQKVESTLKADKIYGLLGLTDECAREFLSPAQSESFAINDDRDANSFTQRSLWSLSELYTRTTILALLQQGTGNSLDPLMALKYGKVGKTIQGLPSWVADWTIRDVETSLSQCYRADGTIRTWDRWGEACYTWKMPCSFGSDMLAVHISRDRQLLGLRGLLADNIEVVGATPRYSFEANVTIAGTKPRSGTEFYCSGMHDGDARAAYTRRWRECRSRCKEWWQDATSQHHHAYKTDSGRREAFWRTLLVNTTAFADEAIPLESHGANLQPWLDSSEPTSDAAQAERLDDFGATIMNFANKRAFVITSKGRFGLAPFTVQNGDVICVLFGAATPFVLRPCASEGELESTSDTHPHRYRLIGEAYVHGIMYGEAVERAGKNDIMEIWLE